MDGYLRLTLNREEKMIAIHKNEAHYKGIRFCARAAAKEDDYYNTSMLCLNITDTKVEATDGHRLHEYTPEKNVKLPSPGVYKILQNNLRFISLERENDPPRFPNTSVVWPEYEEFPSILDFGKDISADYSRLIRMLDDNVTFNFEYLADVEEELDLYFIANDKPAVLERGCYRALIMPRKM